MLAMMTVVGQQVAVARHGMDRGRTKARVRVRGCCGQHQLKHWWCRMGKRVQGRCAKVEWGLWRLLMKLWVLLSRALLCVPRQLPQLLKGVAAAGPNNEFLLSNPRRLRLPTLVIQHQTR